MSYLTNKADLVANKVPTSELGTGTGNTTTFLRGDQTWSTPPGSSNTPVFDVVRDFAADKTGATDSYTAFINWAAAITAAGGGVGLVPPGTYKIDQYHISGGSSVNTVQDIRFDNCNTGMQIVGYGAKINVKGNFNRAMDNGSNSFESSVIPFLFNNCSNFELAGFELNGNVDLMTRSGAVDEGPCYGIMTFSCTSYIIRDIYVHHFATDGVAIGFGSGPADKQGVLQNVRSVYNARQGMSISQVRNLNVTACEFSNTGRAAGTYGGHPPMAGVDIEPNWTTTTTPAVDVITGLITFTNCLFSNNTNSQFITSLAYAVQRVTLRDCAIIAGASTNAFTVVLACDDGLLDGCYIETGGNRVALTWGSPADPLQNTRMRNCEIRSANSMLATDVSAPVVIEDCRFISTATVARTISAVLYIINSQCVFRRNYVFLPAAAYAGSGSFDIAILLQNVRLSADNYFKTDMNPGAGQHFATDYTSAVSVQNETYLSAGSGNTGFRSEFNSPWPNSVPFSIGTGSVGSALVIRANTQTPSVIARYSAMPAAGSWVTGDIVFTISPTSGGKVGWIRLTTGSGNVLGTDWQTFGQIDPPDARYLQVPATTQSTNYTLALTDSATAIEDTSATAANITVPPNSSVAFPLGTVVEVVQYGAGQITVVAGAGVTLRTSSSLTTRAQYSVIAIRQRATNEWIVSGDLT